MKRVVPGALLMLISCAGLGCDGSPKTPLTGATVKGTVKYQGNIITGGEIRLVSVDDPNKSQSGRIDGDGQFEVPNAPTGKVKVVVDTQAAKYDISNFAAQSGGAVDASQYGKPVKYMKIADKYASVSTTDYTIDINKGVQTVAIDLP